MSKYIIDTDDFEPMLKVDSIGVFGTGKSVTDNTEDHSWSRIRTIEEFEELNSDYINEHYGNLQDEAYQRGLHEGNDIGYEDGFEDGKLKSEDGCTGCKYEGKVATGQPCISCCNSYKNQWTAKSDKIEVGDEVNWLGDCFIVTRIFQPRNMKEQCDGIDDDGCVYHDVLIKELEKTGRHFDIASILEDMRND